MKKLVTIAAALLAASALFAEGFKVGGYFRSGVDCSLDDGEFRADSFHGGKYYGMPNSRLRLNMSYEKDSCDLLFRYQASGFTATADNWFSGDNIKWAMARGKLFDGIFAAEAGKLKDTYTSADGFEGYNFCDAGVGGASNYGLRAVVTPFAGLSIAAQASTLYADNIKTIDADGNANSTPIFDADRKAGAISAKYSNSSFAVAGGFHFAGAAYGYFGLKAVNNLKLNVELYTLGTELSGKTDKDGDRTFNTTVLEDICYRFVDFGFEVGMLSYQKLVKDNNAFEFYPRAAYDINKTFTVSLEAGIFAYEDTDINTNNFNITPAVCMNAGSAKIRAYYTYDKEYKNFIGGTVTFNL